MASSWRPNWAGVIVGLVIAGGALGISLGSYDNASRGGGTYVVLWGAALAGAVLALRSLTRTSGSIEAGSRRRTGEAHAESLKRVMSPADWQVAKQRHTLQAGALLSDAEVANRVVAENHAREDERAARWRANAASLYAPIVDELRRSMTPQEWEAKREDATYSMKASRERARRYWLEQAPSLPPELRTPPKDLDPSLDHEAEDWQVAMHLRPMRLDGEGRPITATT